ncbi:hypothetical protein [Pedobacter agri]|uniref:hypothetical protein n=1 Tax=Pedobacter agri TaxID=454586 RepID=UPI0027841A58|nr:hypothetical protein [Pedobacter agri]MDQ1141828.1 hypothetical protein [Pedobacter agri]
MLERESGGSGKGNVETTIKCKTTGRAVQGLHRFFKRKINQAKEMKILDKAKMKQVARIISIRATAYVVVVLIVFIVCFIIMLIRIGLHLCKLALINSNTEKRVIHKFIHNRKHGLFTVIPDDAGNIIREMETMVIML